jgi:hypothetical protein
MNNNKNNKDKQIQQILILYNNAKTNGSIIQKNKYYKQLLLLHKSS